MTSAALADAVLVVHALFVVFVVGGLVATWIGVALGADGYVTKPFRVAGLTSAVKAVLGLD